MFFYTINFLLFFYLCFIGIPNQGSAQKIISLDKDFELIPIVDQGYFLSYNEKDKIDWDSIQKIPIAAFHPLEKVNNNLGISNKSHWIRFNLKNESIQNDLTIEFISPYVTGVQFFYKSVENEFISKNMGIYYPLNNKNEKHFNYHFNLTIKPLEKGICYINIQKSLTTLFFDIFIWNRVERMIYTEKERNFLGFYFFIILLFFLIMAFAQLVIKINNYQWFYIISCVFFGGIVFLDLGLGNLFIFKEKPIFSFLGVFLLVTLFFFCLGQFLKHFLNSQKNSLFFSAYFKILHVLTFIVMLLNFKMCYNAFHLESFVFPLFFIRAILIFYFLYTLLIILIILNDFLDKKRILENLSILFTFSFRVIGGLLLLCEYMGYSKNMAIFNRTYLNFFFPITLTINSVLLLGFVIEIVGIFIILAYRILKSYQLNIENSLMISQKQISNFNALVLGVEQERQRIAQDLHDGLGVLLSTIKMKMSIEHESKQSNLKLEYIMEDIDSALEDVRSISRNLMPKTLSKLGFNRAVEELIESIRGLNPKMNIELIKIVDNERLIESVGVNIYRILQELLQNVIKHSNASELIIQLFSRDHIFIIMVEDNGIGFNYNNLKTNGIGIENIKYRVLAMQGIVVFDSFIGKGTTVSIEIPLKNVFSN